MINTKIEREYCDDCGELAICAIIVNYELECTEATYLCENCLLKMINEIREYEINIKL